MIRIVIAEDCLGLWQKLSKSSPLYASLKIVCGGASRWQSVHNGLASLPPTTPGDIVLVHDGARPVVPPEVVHAVAEAAAERLAAIPAVAAQVIARFQRVIAGCMPVVEVAVAHLRDTAQSAKDAVRQTAAGFAVNARGITG